MGFKSLAPQPAIHPPEALAYSIQALELSARALDECDVKMDIAYGIDERQVLDVYCPAQGRDQLLPVLFFIHGGGWTNGYKEWMGLLAPSITAFPAIFISASCRLAPTHRFPLPFQDCLDALTWTYDNIRQFGGDPDRIFAGGHSSGGHLTALAALRMDSTDRTRSGFTLRGCFPVSSRFNMVFGDPEPGSVEHRHQSMLFSPGQDATPASPLHQIGACRTPFLLTYGDRDLPSIIDNNEIMLAALQGHDVPVERLVLKDHDHFDTALETRHPASPWMNAIRRRMRDEV